MTNKTICLLLLLACFSSFLKAEEDLGPELNTLQADLESSSSPFTSEVEFGYQGHSGNTDSQALNSRLEAEFTSGRYRHSGEFRLYKLVKDGEEDKFQLSYQLQSDYKLSPDTYLFSSFKGVDSRHTAYYKDYTLSAGLGYQFNYAKQLEVELEFGPGYRYQEPNLDEIDDDDIIFPNVVKEPILRGSLNANWKIVDNLSIAGLATVIAGESNTRIDTEVSIINNITDDIALKIVSAREYHDKVPEGLSNADTTLSINLLFYF